MDETKKRRDQVTIKIWPKTLARLRELADAYDEPMVRLLNRLVSKEVLERSAAAEQWAEMRESMTSATVAGPVSSSATMDDDVRIPSQTPEAVAASADTLFANYLTMVQAETLQALADDARHYGSQRRLQLILSEMEKRAR